MEYIPLGKTGVAAGLICKNFAVNLNVAIQVVLVCVVTIDAAFRSAWSVSVFHSLIFIAYAMIPF